MTSILKAAEPFFHQLLYKRPKERVKAIDALYELSKIICLPKAIFKCCCTLIAGLGNKKIQLQLILLLK